MSEDWSKEAAKRLRERSALERQQQSLVLQEEKIRGEQGPYLWAEVQKKVKDMCEGLNREYGEIIMECEAARSDELKVRIRVTNGGYRELYAAFAPTSAPNALRWSISDPRASHTLGAEYRLERDGGKIVFLATNSVPQIVQSPDAIAEAMLNALLG